MELVLGLVFLLALGGAFLLLRSGRARQANAGLPGAARVVYSDAGAWERVAKPLYSRRYRLTGKPDYIVRDENGTLIPIEVKPNRREQAPRDSDRMQLAAYGLLVEETYGERPAFGLLKYHDRLFEVEFDDDLRRKLVSLLAEMRAARRGGEVSRSHTDLARCRYCGYRDACDQRLE